MSLYVIMALLFAALAALQAADAALVNFGLLPWFNGMRWLRVHFITLGALTEVLFGALPLLVARLQGRPRPAFRWDIWLALNGGILALLVGIPLVNKVPIYAGGGLVFAATLLLMQQLWGLRGAQAGGTPTAGRKFYLMGLAFFLVGILIGTGLWFGWSDWLRIAVPLEAHIHANNWGLMSLLFAGLIVDLYPRWTGRPLARPGSVSAIFWLMSAGALLLVLGPWFNSLIFTVPGLVLHLAATSLLLFNMVQPVWGDRAARMPGLAHLITGYAWIIAPLLVAPLIILGVEGVPGQAIEANAPQALIYGWLLQVGFAIVPYFFRRVFQPGQPATLGGSWLSLTAAHLGGLFLWLGIFLVDARGPLHGAAYALWTAALLPFVWQLFGIARAGLARWEEGVETAVSAAD